ncbi:hypothetical protein H6G94_34065 [Nostoc punctiforme FACHB-252]|uniref:Uncharacterized protein n=1 Tax=Nostoc punctiforme FACHB-252 TaxID=1357509 RepID=A0ABR8HLY2_NOSPU|nr:effector-associated domain EAD1-containing protein [Nostoc punctiforme]MBD2616214.1 hypothetical protein [Nostoc punctiforme FACHB-252]
MGIQLNNNQQKLLSEALRNAFIRESNFEPLARLTFDKALQQIIIATNLEQLVTALIEEANRLGLVEKLMDDALELNPGNPKLKLAVAIITLNYILEPLEQDYIQEMYNSYLACCSKMLQENDSNGYLIPNKIEIILDKVIELDRQLERQLDRLGEFAVRLCIQAKISNLTELNEWGKKRTNNFSEYLIKIKNNNSNDKHKVIEALRKLNFYEQVKLFYDFTEEVSVGACIINGKTGYGQEWLLNRLIPLIAKHNGNNENKEMQCIPITVNQSTYSNKIDYILYDLNKRLGNQSKNLKEIQHKIDAIIHTVCEILKNRSVILILKLENFVSAKKECIHEFISKVWRKLVEKACKDYNTSHPHKLLLFLVDLEDCIGGEESLKNLLEEIHHSPSLVKFLKIQKFSDEHLITWQKHHFDDLPAVLLKGISSTNIKEVLLNQCKDGEPLLVLEYICKLWGHELFDLEHIWRNY